MRLNYKLDNGDAGWIEVNRVCFIYCNETPPFKRITPLTAYVQGVAKFGVRMVAHSEADSGVYGADLIESFGIKLK
jgi:hypothetical protein